MPNGSMCREDHSGEYRMEIAALKAENARLRAKEIAARVWCDEEMEKYEMDPDACHAIAEILCGVMVKQES